MIFLLIRTGLKLIRTGKMQPAFFFFTSARTFSSSNIFFIHAHLMHLDSKDMTACRSHIRESRLQRGKRILKYLVPLAVGLLDTLDHANIVYFSLIYKHIQFKINVKCEVSFYLDRNRHTGKGRSPYQTWEKKMYCIILHVNVSK